MVKTLQLVPNRPSRAAVALAGALLGASWAAPAMAQGGDGSGEEPSPGSGAAPAIDHRDSVGSGEAAPLSAEVVVLAVQPDPVRIGEPVLCDAAISLPEGARLAAVRIAGNAGVELLGESEFAHPDAPVGAIVRRLDLRTFRPGRFAGVTVEVQWIAPDGAAQTVRSEPFAFLVESVLAGLADPQPEPPPPPLPVLTRNLVPVVAGGVTLLGLLGGIGALIWRRRAAAGLRTIDVGPPRPGWEVALDGLEQLGSSGWLEAGRDIDFHARLSELIRAYVAEKFRFNALELTTSEIRSELESRRREAGAWVPEIDRVLMETDLVKFARFRPLTERSRDLLVATKKLVMDISARDREAATTPEGAALPPSLVPPLPPSTEQRIPPVPPGPSAGGPA